MKWLFALIILCAPRASFGAEFTPEAIPSISDAYRACSKREVAANLPVFTDAEVLALYTFQQCEAEWLLVVEDASVGLRPYEKDRLLVKLSAEELSNLTLGVKLMKQMKALEADLKAKD